MDKYKVIEVIDESALLIDYGLKDGARKGNTLRIIEKGKPVVIDGTNYGTLDAVKEVVEVDVPYENFSHLELKYTPHSSAYIIFSLTHLLIYYYQLYLRALSTHF